VIVATSFTVPAKNWTGNGGDFGYQRLQQRLRVVVTGKVCTLSGPEWKELRLRGLLGSNGEAPYESALQGIRENLHSWAIELFEQLVMYSAAQPSGKAPGQSCSASASIEDFIAMKRAGAGFFTSQKRRADLYVCFAKMRSG
jgi:hypothetical protein